MRKIKKYGGVAVDFSFSSHLTAATTGTANVDMIVENWVGTTGGKGHTYTIPIEVSIRPGCTVGKVCATAAATKICSGDIALVKIDGNTFVFVEQNMGGESYCFSGSYDYLQPLYSGIRCSTRQRRRHANV